MSRARQHFRQSDLVKALKALAKVGTSGRVEIAPDGRIIVIAGKPEQEQNSKIEETSADLRRLDAMKAKRPTGGLMLRRDKDGREWAGKNGSLSYLEHRIRDIITAAGLRPELSFTSFGRHGGPSIPA